MSRKRFFSPIGQGVAMRDQQKLPVGLTPRLLTAEQAAAYCNVGRENFEARVGVPPLRLFGARTLYDIRALDRWLDRQSGIAENEAEDRAVDWANVLK
jgi:hypothetical protein